MATVMQAVVALREEIKRGKPLIIETFQVPRGNDQISKVLFYEGGEFKIQTGHDDPVKISENEADAELKTHELRRRRMERAKRPPDNKRV